MRFRISDNLLICEIEDNGPGMKNAGSVSQPEPEGNGWNITRERVELLNDQYDGRIQVEVKTVDDDHGTIVTFKIPID